MNNSIIVFFILFTAFKQPNYCKLSDKIYFPYIKELKKHGIFLIGSGGAMMDDIGEVYAHFTAQKKMNIEEARRLYVEIMEGFISRYNASEAIRPYLHEYPCTYKTFNLRLSFRDASGKHIKNGSIAYMSIYRDKIFYSISDSEKKKLVTVHNESYEAALERL